MNQSSLKCLVLDIETSPVLAYVWGLRDQNVSLNMIKDDWHVMAWSAKWLGDPVSKIIYHDQRNAKNVEDDKKILQILWNLLDQADIVITQNGQNFDGPKINARFIMHGMKPPSPYRHLDTYQIARRVASFTSNKLEYLTDKLCKKYKKLPHKKFSGFSLWRECLAGNKQAWDEMQTYNIYDVLSTEELYMALRAWTPQAFPAPFRSVDPSVKCRVCGGTDVQKRGVAVKQKFMYQRYQCRSCGAWQQGARIKEAA